MRKVNYEPLSPLHFLERSTYVFPDKTAVIYNDTKFTFSQFKDRVCRLATALKQQGIKLDDKVAFLCPNTPYLLEGHHSVPLIGGVIVPINTRLAPEEIAYILENSQSKFLFVDTELGDSIKPVLDKVKKLGVEIVNICDVQEKAFDAPDYEEFIDVEPEEFFFGVDDELQPISLNYTSGTTGRPKGVLYSHRGAYLNALGEVLEYHIRSDSKYLWTLPMFHCNGWCHTWAVFAPGATQICLRKVVAKDIFSNIEKHGATHLCGAPVVLAGMSDYAKNNEVKFTEGFIINTAGAPPSPSIIKQMEHLGSTVTQCYGLTELYGPHSLCEWKKEWDDIPILGTLFKSTSFQKKETELVIIATPRFIKPIDGKGIPLPTDSYQEPDNAEIYLNIRKPYVEPSKTGPIQGELDGEFGHTFEDN